MISKFFRDFQGCLKIQVEIAGAGKGGEAGAIIMYPQKSLKSVNDVQTDTSRLKPWVAEKEAPSAQ